MTLALPGFIAKLLIDDTGGTPAEIAELRELSLDVDDDVIDVTSHDSNEFREFIRGLRSYTMTAGLLLITGEAEWGKVRAALLAGTLMDFQLLEKGTATSGDPRWSGSALVQAGSLGFPVDDAQTTDITLQGSGVLVFSSIP